MKVDLGWHWPDREQHLLDWMKHNGVPLNGRLAYQGKKQVACTRHFNGRNRVAIDIGAHIGLWSYNLSHWFDEVFAFEPMLDHRECFRENLKDRTNVQLLPYALGEKPGVVSMQTNASSTGDTWVKLSEPGDVEMKTLDSFGFERVDFVKIDTEGLEEIILRGAIKTITTWRPAICVEQKREMSRKFGCEPQGAVKLLKSLGYRVAEELSGDFIMVPA